MNCYGFVCLVLKSQQIHNPIKEIIDFIQEQKDFPLSILNHQPSPLHYVFFLDNNNNKQYWSLITNANLLTPGDLIVYTKHTLALTKRELDTESGQGQHIMIVANKPEITHQNQQLLWVPIFDSTRTPHGNSDSRLNCNNDNASFGFGKIGLLLDENHNPSKIIWNNYSDNYNCNLKRNSQPLIRIIRMARIIKF